MMMVCRQPFVSNMRCWSPGMQRFVPDDDPGAWRVVNIEVVFGSLVQANPFQHRRIAGDSYDLCFAGVDIRIVAVPVDTPGP
ncbi:MAG: hypothetical protein R2704_01765 [Microthrixaceae bacterium]